MVKAKAEVEAVSKERDEARPSAVLLSACNFIWRFRHSHSLVVDGQGVCGGAGGEEGGEAAVSVRPSQEAATC